MSNRIIVQLECPKCGLPVNASVHEDIYKGFLLYVCPKCHGNVVYYDNKVDLISDRLLRKLIRKNKLQSCGNIDLTVGGVKTIDADAILDLRILLETSRDINDFLSKI